MADEIPLIVERDGKVLTLSLNNVDKKNALTSEIMGALSAILEDVETVSYTHLTLPTNREV